MLEGYMVLSFLAGLMIGVILVICIVNLAEAQYEKLEDMAAAAYAETGTVLCDNRDANGGRTCMQCWRESCEFWCHSCCCRFDHSSGKHGRTPYPGCYICEEEFSSHEERKRGV